MIPLLIKLNRHSRLSKLRKPMHFQTSSTLSTPDSVLSLSMDAQDQAPLLQIPDYTPDNSGYTPAQCKILSSLAIDLAQATTPDAILPGIAPKSPTAEGCARFAALALRPAAAKQTERPTLASMDYDDFSNEIPFEVQALATQFAGLPMGEIVKIFANKFHPMNLYKLRYFRGSEEDMYRVQIRIYEDGALKLLKVTIGSYKDYGDDNTLWSEAFLNYSMILISLCGKNNSSALFHAMVTFHRTIIGLSRKYQWQGAVLSLALDFHIYIVGDLPTDPARWELSIQWQARFCNPITDLAIRKRKRTNSPSSTSASASASKRTKDANNSSVICLSFNRGSCSRANCRRKHACTNCASEDHGFRKCKKVGEE